MILLFVDHCKHAVAFLFWLHRRSEEPSVTSQVCYWKKSVLSDVGKNLNSDLASICKKQLPTLATKGNTFLNAILETCPDADGGIFDIHRIKPLEVMSVHYLHLEFSTKNENKESTKFLAYMKGKCEYKIGTFIRIN